MSFPEGAIRQMEDPAPGNDPFPVIKFKQASRTRQGL
jgi:hypothetical protein